MNDPIDEQLSAFIDGELPMHELELLMARIDRDPARRARLARYGQISALLGGPAVSPGADELADRVQAALAREVGGAAGRLPAQRFAVARWGAVAAALAVLAILWGGPEPGPAPTAELAVAGDPAQGLVAPATPRRSVASSAGPRLTPPNSARLTTYLVYHGRHTGSLSARVVDARLLSRNMERAELRRAEYRTGD